MPKSNEIEHYRKKTRQYVSEKPGKQRHERKRGMSVNENPFNATGQPPGITRRVNRRIGNVIASLRPRHK